MMAGLAVLGTGLAACPAGASTDPNHIVEAVSRLKAGDIAGAGILVRKALAGYPDDADLRVLAGTVLLHSGQFVRAQAEFRTALETRSRYAVALYGLAMAQLGAGERAQALSTLRSATASGADPVMTTLAREYAQWLDGVQIDPGNAAVPDGLAPTRDALAGMNAARAHDWKQVREILTRAYESCTQDPVKQPSGLLMAFDPAHPLGQPAAATGAWPPDPPRQPGDTLSGTVQFEPEHVVSSARFASYAVDGQTVGLVNTPPFTYVWDSRRVSNGWHNLEIMLDDAEGQTLSRITRRIRVSNQSATLPGLTADESDGVRADTVQALALQPDRCACAYELGAAARTLGDVAAARNWFERAAALHPGYYDVKREWRACGGVPVDTPALWGGLSNEKLVALTFDDGPRPGITDPLLDMLKAQGVTATFFVVGMNVAKYPDLTKLIADSGMEIANHSYTHPNLTHLSPDAVASELLKTQVVVQQAAGVTPKFIRPPGGNWSGAVGDVARAWGLIPCMWTVDVYGSEVVGAQEVADAVVAQVRPGSIILMHNGKYSTMEALPTILRVLRKQGYRFVTVSDLAQRLFASRDKAAILAKSVDSGVRRSE
jgi:peptidoglycan/xylan/chitin deacetylase (PgdA/CDA1 family)